MNEWQREQDFVFAFGRQVVLLDATEYVLYLSCLVLLLVYYIVP